jgi:uncharacterized iron-regulated membrane protein
MATTVQPQTPTASHAGKPAPHPGRTRLLFRIHRWTGLLSGLVIVFLSITGALLVFKDELDEMLNPHLLVVQPGAERIPLERAMEIAQEGFQPEAIYFAYLPEHATRPYWFVAEKDGGLWHAMVNPYTGEYLGFRSAKAQFADVLRQMHIKLFYFGATGRIVVGIFGIVMLLSAVTGLLIYGPFMRGQSLWKIPPRPGAQYVQSAWHKRLGFASAVFQLLIAFTGAILGLENLGDHFPVIQDTFHPFPVKRGVWAEAGARPSLDVLVERAGEALPGFQAHMVNLPNKTTARVMVAGNTVGSLRMRDASWVSLNAADGAVLETHDERAVPWVTQAYLWMDPLHFGYFGGVFFKLLYFLLGLSSGFLAASGYIVWWMKRRHARRHRAGAGKPLPAMAQ